MNAYAFTLLIHSYLRWIVLALAVVVVLRCVAGWLQAREWLRLDDRLHVAFVASVDAQMLIGIVLYAFLSPISGAMFHDTSAAMHDPVARFFGVEHLVGMVAAVALVHVGRARSRKAATPKLRYRNAWLFTLIALIVMLASIPWPGLTYARPFLRGVSASAAPSP
jgi:preprotein translocase subunit SecY